MPRYIVDRSARLTLSARRRHIGAAVASALSARAPSLKDIGAILVDLLRTLLLAALPVLSLWLPGMRFQQASLEIRQPVNVVH